MKAVDFVGKSGGLILLWKKDIEVRVSDLNNRFIAVRIHDSVSNLFWRAIFVYVELVKDLRSTFYDPIINKVSNTHSPLLYFGDWNCIWDRGDKVGGICISNSCIRNVHRILDKENLLDLGYYGPHFTWINKQSGDRHIKERLDRAAVNDG